MEVTTASGTDTLRFLYENGSPIGYLLNESTPFFYVKNLAGDITAVVTEGGAVAAEYCYDSWGNLLDAQGDSAVLAINPLTYRGYLYDGETGLYYLQTRYYNPQWCRFINADTNLDTGTSIIGTNLFAYCDNNPVMKVDYTGEVSNQSFVDFWNMVLLIGTAILAAGLTIFKTANADDYCLYSVTTAFFSKYKSYGLSTFYVEVEVKGKMYYLSMVVGDYSSWSAFYKEWQFMSDIELLIANGFVDMIQSGDLNEGSLFGMIMSFFYYRWQNKWSLIGRNIANFKKSFGDLSSNQHMAMIYNVRCNNMFGSVIYQGPGFFSFYL